MNRSAKLIAYTLFALFFPLWIFLGRISEKPNTPTVSALDTNNLKLILKVATDINAYNTNSNENNQAAWRAMLQKVLESNSRPTASTIKVDPVNVDVTLKDVKPVYSETIPPQQINTDSIEHAIKESGDELDDLGKIRTSKAGILATLNLNSTERSVQSYIKLTFPCCENFKDTVKYYQNGIKKLDTQLTDSLNAYKDRKNSDDKIYKLKKLLGQLQTEKEFVLKLSFQQCDLKNYIAIRNNSGSIFRLPDTLNYLSTTILKLTGINSINEIPGGARSLRPNETAYYKLQDDAFCKSNDMYELYHTLKIDFDQQNGFLRRVTKGSLFVNFQFIR